MGDRVIVTSGLSKAYGIPGVRIGWMVGPKELVDACWSQHDYITIGPNKMSDRIARVAVEAKNRERCYARTGEILRHNLPIAQEWAAAFGGRLKWTPPTAGAIALMRYDADTPSLAIAERIRSRSEHADRARHARRHRRPPAHLARGPGGVSCGKDCGASAPS